MSFTQHPKEIWITIGLLIGIIVSQFWPHETMRAGNIRSERDLRHGDVFYGE